MYYLQLYPVVFIDFFGVIVKLIFFLGIFFRFRVGKVCSNLRCAPE